MVFYRMALAGCFGAFRRGFLDPCAAADLRTGAGDSGLPEVPAHAEKVRRRGDGEARRPLFL